MPDKGVQCCLNDSHVAHISAEIAYLRKVIDNLKDEMDGYSNQWLHDYNKIISMEKIFIGKRIRDIIYNDKNNIFLLALEGKKFAKSSDGIPSIGILKVSKD